MRARGTEAGRSRRRGRGRGRLAGLAALAAGLLLLVPCHEAAAAPTVTLEGPARVDGLRLADADGDGLTDVLLLEGRTLLLYRGRREGLPEPAPTRRLPLPPDAAYVAVAGPAAPGGAGLLVLGPQGLRHVNVLEGRMHALDIGPVLPGWTDGEKACFVDFAREDGTLLLPRPEGLLLVHAGDDGLRTTTLPAPPYRELEPAGPFLEDNHRVVQGHRHPVLTAAPAGAPEGTGPTFWLLAGDQVLAQRGDLQVTRRLLRLPPRGVRRLVDLDGNGLPDLFQAQGTNRFATYSFYRLPLPALAADTPKVDALDLGAPATRLRLEGSPIDPTLVDLDGDGRLDFVVTLIPIDARNTARALGGAVTANTMAYLQRPGEALFPKSPDASIASDVGVAIRFSQAGTIDVRRSFTILPNADVDGDGRKDLVVRTDGTTLTIHRGARSGVWEKEGRAVPIPPMELSPNVEGYRADLDGDGGDEIVLLYRAPHEGRDLLRVVDP